jgi:oligopeptide/dipeptide ABC transporter ATP-binding protein
LDTSADKANKLLIVKDLKTYFYTYEGIVEALDGVHIAVAKGETVGLVGETASGKSVTAMSILRLIAWPPGKIVDGQIYFKGRDILKLSEIEMQKIRGSEIAMIFQEPTASLNPVYTIGHQIKEAITLHSQIKTKKEARERTVEMLEIVEMADPVKTFEKYPHELSGGMQQRVMIAMALSCHPDMLIADEPTTALDVTIQSQILDLMADLQERIGMAILLITHDLGVVAEVCDRVAVMYAGVIVEDADIKAIFKEPKHPYTVGLLSTIPKVEENQGILQEIQGQVPRLINPPNGCRFHPRCAHAMDRCRNEKPGQYSVGNSHTVACFLYK